MQRNPRPQDISWFLDLNSKGQLDLNPPYQRRSVWPKKDREFFIDTIFKNYPAPPVFLHKTMTPEGQQMFHVVDGKQRLETIIAFSKNELTIPATFGDANLNGKKFNDLSPEAKMAFWNYAIQTEQLPEIDEAVLNSVFERINRNNRKLTRQELRHAKFDGWFASFVEQQASEEAWSEIGLLTKARAKRMADAQFLSELLIVVIRNKVVGFDQDMIDQEYAIFEEPDNAIIDLTTDEITEKFAAAREFLRQLCLTQPNSKGFLKTQANLYSLWAWAVLNPAAANAADAGAKYLSFMQRVAVYQNDPMHGVPDGPSHDVEIQANIYSANLSGASTDEGPRKARAEALTAGILLEP